MVLKDFCLEGFCWTGYWLMGSSVRFVCILVGFYLRVGLESGYCLVVIVLWFLFTLAMGTSKPNENYK